MYVCVLSEHCSRVDDALPTPVLADTGVGANGAHDVPLFGGRERASQPVTRIGLDWITSSIYYLLITTVGRMHQKVLDAIMEKSPGREFAG